MTDSIGRTIPIDPSHYNSLSSSGIRNTAQAQTSSKTANDYPYTNQETSAAIGTVTVPMRARSLASLDPAPRLERRMAEHYRVRGGKLTVLNPVPPIRRIWLRASEALSAGSQVSPTLSLWIRLSYQLTLRVQGDSYRLHLVRL